MHVRDRRVFLDDATRLAGFRALRPAGVASIYYDEHTPASSSHSGDPDLQGAGGGSYTGQLRSAGQLNGMPEANLEMDWDIEEPPTQMWAPGHALALQRSAAQRAPSQSPPVPTRSGMRPPPPPPEALRVSQRPTFAPPASVPHAPARRTGQHQALAGASPSPARRTGQHQAFAGASPSPARRTGQHQAFAGAAQSPARRTGQHQAFAGHAAASPFQATRTGQHQAFAGHVGGPASNAKRTDPHPVFAGQMGTLPPQVRRTGQHQAAAALASTSQQVRPRSISETRTRSVDPSASQSVPQVQWAPPPRPRDALFPELANDSNFYPGLVPAAHEFNEDENPFAHKRSKGTLWYVAYAVAGLTVIGAGLALFSFLHGPTTVSVMIETTPGEATVTIDGHALAGAASPYTLAGLGTGEHVLQVQKPGFEDYRQVLTLSEQETKRIVSVNLNAIAKAAPPAVEPIAAPEPQIVLPPPPSVSKWHAKSTGSASTAGMSAAEIAKQHRSEVRAAKIAARWREAHGLPPRENTLANSVDVTEVSRPTHAKREPREPRQAREPREAASDSASAAPVAAPAAESGKGTGTLQINSRPWANVYVDGQMVGHTPQMGLSLPAGRHTIKLENPTMNMSKSLSITIQAGQTLTKVETLSE